MIRTLLPALSLVFAGAAANAETPSDQLVSFEITVPASPAETLQTIDAQAWTACAPTAGSASIFDRSHQSRRACQEALVRDVVKELADPDLIAALEAREIEVQG